MTSKLIEDQLKKVEFADLSNFNKETNTYLIRKRVDIKIQEDHIYLIQIKPSCFNNDTVIINWNGGNKPPEGFLQIDVSKVMNKMIKVVGVSYDNEQGSVTNKFWSGWLSLDDISIIRQI